jgi:hypothetical protein
VIDNPELLLGEARRYIDELTREAETRIADQERLHMELEAVAIERQWVITQA